MIFEEKEYQRKLQWLKDHEDMTGCEKNRHQDLLVNLYPTDWYLRRH
jgi:hypothetical protein